MVSHTEIAVVKANGHAGTRKVRSRNGIKKPRANAKSPAQNALTSQPAEPAGTDVAPIMKLRAIDLVDCETPKATSAGDAAANSEEAVPSVLHMPPPLNLEGGVAAENLVTDPELLELLQQLSETIDTANTVLESAGPSQSSEEMPDSNPVIAQGGGEQVEKPMPQPGTELPEPTEEDLPLAAISEALSKQGPQLQPNHRFGFGLFLNAAISGLVLTAGAAWLVYTNPWLLDHAQMPQISRVETAASVEPSKDQSSLVEPAPQLASATPTVKPKPQALASLAPPSAYPAPMQTSALKQKKLEAQISDEPVHTQAGKPVALNVSLAPGAESSETSVMVQGVPAESKLSQGKSLGSGNWLLNEKQLENLKLETGTTLKPGEHVIEFIVVRSDGSVPETRKISVMVDGPEKASSVASAIPVATASQTSVARQSDLQQASTPLRRDAEPEQVTLPALSPAEVKALLARGTSLLEEGDVAGARLLLEYAAQRGSKEAMVKLAQSYDPDHLLKLAVHGVQPDAEMSAHWYDRAETAQK